MKNIFTLLFLTLITHSVTAQVTAIPDPAFEQALIDLNIDSDGTVNGQVLTSDVASITSLYISSGYQDYIYDVTGLEAFTALITLKVGGTMIEELDVSTLVNLKSLDCTDNMLTSIDVSNNTLLEYLDISSVGDVLPINSIIEVDLSHNPNIKQLVAVGANHKINLKNGNNNPDMKINISATDVLIGYPPGFINGNTCIEVDDAPLAQNNQYPYSEWIITHNLQTYSFTDLCTLTTPAFTQNQISIYPNPATDVVYINANGNTVSQATLYDISGCVVREYTNVAGAGISISGLQKGMYVIKIESGNNSTTQKILVQ
jgi:hypothetical protein